MKAFRHIFTVLLFLATIVDFTAAQAQSANPPCAVEDSVSTFVVFTNNTLHNLNFNWINYECTEELYATLEPGQSTVIQTFVTHPWIARRADTGAQVGEVVVPDSGLPLVHEAVCSLDGSIESPLTIVNSSDAPAKFYWVDQECNEIEYGTLAPGETFIQSTYDTHAWVLRSADTGELIGSAVATALTNRAR